MCVCVCVCVCVCLEGGEEEVARGGAGEGKDKLQQSLRPDPYAQLITHYWVATENVRERERERRMGE